MAWRKVLQPLGRRERNDDPQFQKVKVQLANVATALEACTAGLETITSDYTRLYKGISQFATDFYSLYPSEDGVRKLGKATVESAESLIQDVENRALDSPELASIHAIDRQIKAYLSEIRTMQAEFKKVAAARHDWETAHSRLERTQARNKPGDEDRRAWLADQTQERRVVYETMLDSLTRRLASTYNKHSQVFQAAWTAYILRLEDGKNMLEVHMRSHRSYAKRLEKDVLRMQLGTIDDLENQEN